MRYLFIGMLVALSIGGVTTLLIKAGVLRWPLKVATGPSQDGGPGFISTVTQVFAEERPLVQIRRVRTESLAASAKALETGDADVAVVRSDIAMPANGLTVAILRRDNLVLVVPAHSRIEAFQELAGKKVGLLKEALPERDQSLEHLFDAVLAFYSIAPGQVRRELLSIDEVGRAVARREVAGVVVLGPAGPGPIAKTIAAIAHATKATPELIGDKQAEAVAKTIPGAEPNEIEVGAFGGASPKPDEALPTVAVTLRMVARHTLPDYVAGEIARMLSLAKARLAATSRVATHIEAPDSEDGSGLPVHPGAAAYFNGEQGSLVESATNVLYLGSIILGVFGSGFVWLLGAWRRRAADGGQADIDRLIEIMREGRGAAPETLDGLDAEIDEIVVRSLGQGKGRSLDAEQLNVLSIIIPQARTTLEKRRATLRAGAA